MKSLKTNVQYITLAIVVILSHFGTMMYSNRTPVYTAPYNPTNDGFEIKPDGRFLLRGKLIAVDKPVVDWIADQNKKINAEIKAEIAKAGKHK